MGTHMTSWAFTDTGAIVPGSDEDDGPLPTQNYNLFSLLDGQRASQDFDDRVRIDRHILIQTLRDPVWLRDPVGHGFGMYTSRVVDMLSGRREYDRYGPPTLMETCITRGGIADEFYNGYNTPMKFFSIQDFLNYDWNQLVRDDEGNLIPARVLVGEATMSRLCRFINAGATHIAYVYW